MYGFIIFFNPVWYLGSSSILENLAANLIRTNVILLCFSELFLLEQLHLRPCIYWNGMGLGWLNPCVPNREALSRTMA